MPAKISPHDFVCKWRNVTLNERASAQAHFTDLCSLLGEPTPSEADPTGERYRFEKEVRKQGGGRGYADVWRRDFFAWEYKGPGGDLDKAYDQLLLYREALLNPPLLVVSDTRIIRIHTNFVNTAKRVEELHLDDLLDPDRLEILHRAFADPATLRLPVTRQKVTRRASEEFARLADMLRERKIPSHRVAHFLIQVIFCLFAEDVGLLRHGVFGRLIDLSLRHPHEFPNQMRDLLAKMRTGGIYALEEVPYFNGGLFDHDDVITLLPGELDVLARAHQLDWSSMDASIFGTLFERGLDPGNRTRLGAHYTGADEIRRVVDAVVMAPLVREWEEVQAQARELTEKRAATTNRSVQTTLERQLTSLLQAFRDRLQSVTVLDPACGSGNFLYVALRELLALNKELIVFASRVGSVSGMLPAVTPLQMYGIEINEYARELAQASVWIGYIQWLRENGFGEPDQPILKPCPNIQLQDAILVLDPDGNPVEPVWPTVDAIVGNPPFLGGKLLRSEFGDTRVVNLFRLYAGRVPREADIVTYWFERARRQIERGRAKRAGLLATQSIRGGANRRVLERIKSTGDIFMAWSDFEWVLEGAHVHVSIVGFDDGTEREKILDGAPVTVIHANLTSELDLTRARRLSENFGLAFMGDTKGGAFDISPEVAREMLEAPLNPNGRPNSDVVRPWINGSDVTGRPRGMHIIDFGVAMPEREAALYELPFEHARNHILPERLKSKTTIASWWLHERPRVEMREVLSGLDRFIVTPRVSKHRLFAFVGEGVLPDSATIAVARRDDYFFGVLHSKLHELWARGLGTQLREAESGFRYTPTTTFETFPFPWAPGFEPVTDRRVTAVAEAARELVRWRDDWLNPPGATKIQLRRRTLTNLYNERPQWLQMAHEQLDRAVLDAYGWPHDITDAEILDRLLNLNLERSSGVEQATRATKEPEWEQVVVIDEPFTADYGAGYA